MLPKNANEERKTILNRLGAELITYSPPADGSDGAIRLVQKIVADDPDRFFYPDQYGNPANWQAHFEGTGPRSSPRPAGRSPTSSPAWAPAAPSSASAGGCGRTSPACGCTRSSPTAPGTAWRA